MSTPFKNHDNLYKYALLYLNSCLSFEQTCHQKEPFGLGFVTKLGDEIVRNFSVEEVFIDSTMKTNKSRL